MDIIELLNQYRNVTEFLSDNENMALIDNLKDCLENRRYMLPFIGQFSAGKSKLINRILGKDILPTKRVETTAFLTYISYAEKESAIVEYVDGTKRQIDVAEIKTLDHGNTVNENPIAALWYYTPLEMLKSGLVIVDTPGVNTLIKSHVKMTEELLKNSQHIIYVCASATTDSDKKMMEMIDRLGIEMIYVRTHIDEINDDEEDVYSTINTEKGTIKTLLGKDLPYYSLCNDETNNKFSRWEKQYEYFIEYISDGIASNIEKIYIAYTINRLAVMKIDLEKQLNSRLSLLEKNSEKSNAEIDEILNQLSHQKSGFDNRISHRQEDIKQNAKSFKSTIESELKTKKSNLIKSFNEKIESLNGINHFLESVKSTYTDQLSRSLEQLNEHASLSIKDWATKMMSGIQQDIDEINVLLAPLDIEFDTVFDADDINSYEEQTNAVVNDFLEKYSQAQMLNSCSEDELVQYGVERTKIQEAINHYEEVIAQNDERIRLALESYQPQYVQEGGKLGKIMKRIGTVGDIAMLLIPAVGWEKAGAMLASKAGTLASKGGSLAKTGAEVLKTMGEGATLLSKSDTVLDITKLLGYAKNPGDKSPIQTILEAEAKKKGQGIHGVNEKKAGIFDYLSLSYWFEKVGDFIDPATVVEDEQYRRQYELAVKQLQDEANEYIRHKVELEKKMRQIKDAEEIKKIELEKRAEAEKQMQQELEKERERIQAEKEKAIHARIVQDAEKQYKQSVSDYLNVLVVRVNETVDSTTESFTESAVSFINTQLEDVEHQLQELKEKRANASYDVTQETEAIKSHLSSLTIPNE